MLLFIHFLSFDLMQQINRVYSIKLNQCRQFLYQRLFAEQITGKSYKAL